MLEVKKKIVPCDLCGKNDYVQVFEKQGFFYVKCLDCGFVYTNPREEDVAEKNNEYFESTKQNCINATYSPKKQHQYSKTLKGFSRYKKTLKILEIGSNVGGFLYQARNLGWNPVGIEPVAECSNYAKKEHGLNSL